MTGPAPFTEPAGRTCEGATCGAVIWPVTVASSRRRMWCDSGTLGAPGGTVAVWDDPGGGGLLARVVSAKHPLAAGERLAVAHWATCPDTAQFRARPPGPVHQCPGPGPGGYGTQCEIVNVPQEHLSCAAHWGQVPAGIKKAVSRAWDRGAGYGSASHAAACHAAIARMRPL